MNPALRMLIDPVRYKNINIPRTAIVAVAAENDLLSVRTEHRKGIEAFIMTDLFDVLSIKVAQIHVERETSFIFMIAAEDDVLSVGREIRSPVGLFQEGDRLLLWTDVNETYMQNEWQKRSPHLTRSASEWCIGNKVPLVGFDCYHGAEETLPDQPRLWDALRMLSEADIVTLPSLLNLHSIGTKRANLIALPLRIVGAEASPVRAVVAI